MIQSLTTATTLGGNSKFVGFENYVYMFSDKNFLLAMVNSLKLMAVVPITTLFFSLLFASILVQGQLKEKGFYRTLLFFPSIVSMTVVAIVWSFVFHPTMGILTTLMKSIGLGELVKPWLGDSSTALWCVGIALIWQAAGYYMVMHIAAMDSVSPDVYEAATIDGAGKLKQFLSITLPLIRNIIGITYILSLSGTINLSFILSNVMTAGGPNGASNVLLRYMYTQGMVNANFGYAMSISVFTLFISIILSLASRKMTSKQEG
jgi:N-acetylglucosamine transport system permease protein